MAEQYIASRRASLDPMREVLRLMEAAAIAPRRLD
jgi:hypothetical protein